MGCHRHDCPLRGHSWSTVGKASRCSSGVRVCVCTRVRVRTGMPRVCREGAAAPHPEGADLLRCCTRRKGPALNSAFSGLRGDAPFQLVYLKVAGMLFPTSDFWHPVVTPALVCMSQLLTKVRGWWRMAAAAKGGQGVSPLGAEPGKGLGKGACEDDPGDGPRRGHGEGDTKEEPLELVVTPRVRRGPCSPFGLTSPGSGVSRARVWCTLGSGPRHAVGLRGRGLAPHWV